MQRPYAGRMNTKLLIGLDFSSYYFSLDALIDWVKKQNPLFKTFNYITSSRIDLIRCLY